MKNIRLIVLVVFFLSGCNPPPAKSGLKEHGEARLLFGTTVSLKACYEDGKDDEIKKAFEQVWQRWDEIQWRMNIYDDRSDVVKINNSQGKPVVIGSDTYQLLEDSVFYAKLTRGVFDITVYPLIELWKKSEEKNLFPSPEEVKNAKEAVGSSTLEFLPNNYVRLRHGKAKIDVGGIAAGYAADEAARDFRENHFNNFLVDAGGELFAAGHNCEGTAWTIGISDPRDPTKLIDVLKLVDVGVSTSGSYEKFYEIEGQQFSHIINPITGYPERGVTSASVIAPTAEAADALSTALSILDAEEGVSLIDSLGEGYAAMVIEERDGQIKKYESRRYPRFRSTSKP